MGPVFRAGKTPDQRVWLCTLYHHSTQVWSFSSVQHSPGVIELATDRGGLLTCPLQFRVDITVRSSLHFTSVLVVVALRISYC